MKKKFGIMALLLMLIACFTFGFVACTEEEEDTAGKNPRVVIETDELELALEIFSDYKMPFAGIYDQNLDRVDGKDLWMSVLDPNGDYYVSPTMDYETVSFIETGKYEIVYTASGCASAKIIVYVCERLDQAINFKVEGNTLTWDSVYGASGYEVTVNGQEPIFTENASFTSDIFAEEGFYVGVTTKGDNKTWIDSYMKSYENRVALKEGELAAFNNPCYELDITKATPDKLNGAPYDIKYISEEECAGSTGGAVKFSIRSGEYGTGLFRLNLQNTISKETEYDGIEIRFKLDTKDYVYDGETTATTLLLAQPSADEQRISRGMPLYREYNDSWQILKLPKSMVDGFDGCDFLQFSLYMMTRASGQGTVYLDYVRTYTGELDAPTGVAIDGEKLVWGSVEGASGYTVSVDKLAPDTGELLRGYYLADTAEIALSTLGIDSASATQQYIVKVCAESAVETKGSSAWSEELVQRAALAEDEVLPLDNAMYALNAVNPVVSGSGGTIKTFQHIRYAEYADATGADGKEALRLVLLADGTRSFFTLNLTKPLDLEHGYNGIVLRFKVEDHKYESGDTLGIQLIGSNSDTENYTGLLYRKLVTVGEWQQLQLTNADLATYYETGDTKLSFAINNTVANVNKGTITVTVALDYIRYYKSLPVPTGLTIDEGTLKWNAVEGASGYTVNINGNETFVEGEESTSFDISGVKTDAMLKVRTESNMAKYSYSEYGEVLTVHALGTGELATFNHDSYIYDLEAGSPTVKDAYDDKFAGTFKDSVMPVFYEEDHEKYGGSNGGAVYMVLHTTSYTKTFTGYIYTFTVNLPVGLNLTANDGIKVRFMLDYVSKQSAGEEVYFTVLSAKTQNAGYTTSPVNANTPYTQIISDPILTWQELTVDKQQLADLDYVDGDKQLTFAIWRTDATLSNPIGKHYGAGVLVDDIRYCKMIDAPKNVRLEEGTLKWDTVAGASGYTVKIENETVSVQTNSYSLATVKKDAVLSVRTEPNDSTLAPSVYSGAVNYYYLDENTLASFNHAFYTGNVVAGSPNVKDGHFGNWKTAPTYADGAVSFATKFTSYTSGTGAFGVFAISLPKSIDLTKDGITVRMRVDDTPKQQACAVMALSPNEKKTGYTKAPETVGEIATGVSNPYMTVEKNGEWIEFKISSAQLTALGYQTGDTTLVLGVWVYNTLNLSTTVGYGVWYTVDSVSYYTAQ